MNSVRTNHHTPYAAVGNHRPNRRTETSPADPLVDGFARLLQSPGHAGPRGDAGQPAHRAGPASAPTVRPTVGPIDPGAPHDDATARAVRVHIPGVLTATVHSTRTVDLIPADGLALGPLCRTLKEAGYRTNTRRNERHGANEHADDRHSDGGP